MAQKKIGPIKLKDKPGRRAFEIANQDKTPMVLDNIIVMIDPSSNKAISVVLNGPGPEEVDIVYKKPVTNLKGVNEGEQVEDSPRI